MSLNRCLKKLGLGKHERAIMRAITREAEGEGIEQARNAVRQRLKDLKSEKASIERQVAEASPDGTGERRNPVQAETPEHVAIAAARAAENPSPSQIEAGNAAKGHFEFAEGNPLRGLGVISIETAAGVRRVARDGSWTSPPLPFAYGHLSIAEGADGDKADVTIGDTLDAPNAYVIDQIHADGSFDETKSFVAFKSEQAARAAYLASFGDDATARIGAITGMPVEQFVRLAQADNLSSPVAYDDGAGPPALVASREEEASTVLDAANVRGKDRLDILSKVRAGEYSIEDLRSAYPQATIEEPATAAAVHLTAPSTEDAVAQTAAEHSPDENNSSTKDDAADVAGSVADDAASVPVREIEERDGNSPLFSRSDATIPEGFTVNEANREQTQALEKFLRGAGNNVTVTPVSVPNNVADDAKGGSPKTDFALAERLATVFGKKVIWITSAGDAPFSGVTAPIAGLADYVFINVGSPRPAHSVLGHELTHHMQHDTPVVYRNMLHAMFPMIRDLPGYRAENRITDEHINEAVGIELVGDLLGDNFNKVDFWNKVSKTSGGEFRGIANTVRSWLDKLLGKIRGKLGYGSEKFVTDVHAARRILANALVEYHMARKGRAAPQLPESPLPLFSRALGILTPAQQTALTNVHGTPQTWQQRLNAFRRNWKSQLVQGILDQYAPILKYTDKGYRFARQSKGGDSTLEALLLYGKVYVDTDGAYRVSYNRATGMNGFAKVIAGLKGEQDRFLEWVAAQRAERLKSVGLENLYSDTDIQALKTLNQGHMPDGTSRPQAYATALQQLNDWNDSVLKIAADSGLVDDATRQMYRDVPYVPFYRLQDEKVTGFSVKPGLVNQYAWKKLKGGTEHINDDLLANLLQNWSHLITASAKNRAARETLQAAKRSGAAVEVPSSTPGKGLLHYMDAGNERVFRVSDDDLVDAVSAMHYAGLGDIGKPFVTMKRWLTIGVTVNPAFKIRNLVRDSVQAIGTSPLSYNPAANIKAGIAATTMESDTRAQMLAAGGIIRFGSMLDGNNADRTRRLIEQNVNPAHILNSAGKIERFWKTKMLPAFEAYQELGDRGEQINRAALYERLTANGMSHEEASYWARDLMDFSLSGKWAAIRILTQVVPFMNARLQGLYKLGRARADDYKRMGVVLGAVTLASLGLLLAYGEDEDWKKREDFDRDNFFWFKVGGVAFRLPKPFEIGAAATLVERSVEYPLSDEMTGKRFRERLAAIVFSQLSMNPIPQLIKPVMDLYANKDSFTGRPIETMGMDKLRKQDRYTERTTEIARMLGALGLPDPTQLATGHWNTLSPVQIDSLVRGYFSWLGTSVTAALDWGIRPLMGRGERPDAKLRDAFFAGNFVETLPSNSSRYVTQLYEQATEIEQAYGSYHDALKRGDLERAKEIAADEAEKLAKYRLVETVKRGESRINQQIKQIEAARGLPGDEKRLRLDRLNAAKDNLARMLVGQ